MEGMIHHRIIDDIPHLQLTNLHRLVAMVRLIVDEKVDAVLEAQLESQMAFPVRRSVSGHERLDVSQLCRKLGMRRCSGTHADCREPLVMRASDSLSVVAK